MKLAKLLHNPSAGDEDHKKNELISLIKSKGFECSYASTKDKGWDKIEDETDFLIIAGGDGTIRKVVKKLIEKRLIDKQFPIALLPMGTANNIATTLGFNDKEDIIPFWNAKTIKRIDIGKISGLDELFFLEGFGHGVFPRLMKEMKELDTDSLAPEEELEAALKVLMEIIDSYKAKSCMLEIDDSDHSGNYLLVEVMNIRSIGPNLTLAPVADPRDGFFDVVLISENQREEFKQYISNKLNGIDEPFIFKSIKAKNIKIKWEGLLVHVDDELIENNKEVKIEVMEGVLKFLVEP